MGLYQEAVLPYLIHVAMRQRDLAAYRRRLIAGAQGRVLEIGIGSGLNLPYYGPQVERVIGLDPSSRLLAMARAAGRGSRLDVVEGRAERIPLEARSVDTIVTSWTLCSVPGVQDAVADMRRVLKPAGRLLFVEHGRAPDPRVRWWQDKLTAPWQRLSGGCHLNRAIDALIEAAGFRIERLQTGYLRRPKALTFMYEGSARPR
jgi:ubiquinone/menaquinone biosynthesis C-methylase UbiE